MKLTIIGGGGVRTPLLINSILRRAERLKLEELCLMDIHAEKLQIIGALVKNLVNQAESNVRVTTTTEAQAALEGARYIITTIRVGAEAGRILDEKIALRNGVLGQETTGPGGFAMALRSIPAILNYAELLEKVNPGAWTFNFTNPSGLVTQALFDAGYRRVVGICDGANMAQHAVARWFSVKPNQLHAEVFGLNHLSWTRRVLLDGKDLLHPLLYEPAFRQMTMLRLFEPDLIREIDMFLNEYLFYFYYREEALRQINLEEQTRGEKVELINQHIFEEIKMIDPVYNPMEALAAYYKFNEQRSSTYMPYTVIQNQVNPIEVPEQTTRTREEEEEGYAGVALNIMEAMETGEPLFTGLNVPNQGAISGMADDDVVEVSCRVDGSGIHPLPIGKIPAHQLQLMGMVKLYERLTVTAIHNRSRQQAVMALMNHPLVLSYSLASKLVDEYLAAHRAYIGEWH
jgi:6-phospho-beta-glucosidase